MGLTNLVEAFQGVLVSQDAIHFRFAVAGEPLDPGRLTPAERTIVAALGDRRRAAWLRGRAALKAILGEAADTAAIRFPNASLALTHSGHWAVATAADGLAGVGLDLETRMPPEDAARWFLGPRERARDPRDLQRLWTVKEACFKADPENASRSLRDYELEDPSASRGRAGPFQYASLQTPEGFLTVAWLPKG